MDLFRSHVASQERLASAKAAIIALLAADLIDEQRVKLLKTCLWFVTEAEGHKHKTRFRSAGCVANVDEKLQHEHVYQLKNLAVRLMKNSDTVDEVVGIAVGCTVTRSEHLRLTAISKANPDLDGWARYVKAEVRVFDMATGTERVFAT